ncbi:MAG: translation initiation factor Sui1 [Magnetococcales bacterium]|nr:translation initiation factor Sui1 [Magnetococcales bacterium]
MATNTQRVVYSTELGKMCPECGKPATNCICRKKGPVLPSDGVVRVQRETKGRGGKEVTVIKGVAGDPLFLAQLGKELKTLCGSGGTVKDGVIEVQGDHVERVMEHLQKRGMRVKRAGG